MSDAIRFQEEILELRQKVEKHEQILTVDFKALVERADKRDLTMGQIRDDVREIKTLLTGGDLGGDGLIERMKKVESKIENHESKIVWASGFAAAAGAMAGVFLKKFGI